MFFPDVLPGPGQACRSRGVALHYEVLRAEAALYDRFAGMRDYEVNALEASKEPGTAAAKVRSSYENGRLLVPAE